MRIEKFYSLSGEMESNNPFIPKIFGLLGSTFAVMGMTLMAFNCNLDVIPYCLFYEGITGTITNLDLKDYNYHSCHRVDDVYNEQDCYSLRMDVDYGQGSCEFVSTNQNNLRVAENVMSTYTVGDKIRLLKSSTGSDCYATQSMAELYTLGITSLCIGLLFYAVLVLVFIEYGYCKRTHVRVPTNDTNEGL
jgi:hypothetical protein